MEDEMALVIEHLGGTAPSGYGWRSMKCVSEEHLDRRASARVNLEDGAYKCLACGLSAGSPYQLLQRATGESDAGAKSRYEGIFGVPPSELQRAVLAERRSDVVLGKPRSYETKRSRLQNWIRRRIAEGGQ